MTIRLLLVWSMLSAAIFMLGFSRAGIEATKVRGSDPLVASEAKKVIVRFQHERWLGEDIPAFAWQNQIFVPMVALFNRLSVKVNYDRNSSRLEGFFLSPGQAYSIDLEQMHASRDTVHFRFNHKEFIEQTSEVYFDIHLLNELFGLGLSFEHRNMSIQMRNEYQFPYMVRKRRRARQKNKLHQKERRQSGQKKVAVSPSGSEVVTPGLTTWNIRNGGPYNDLYHAVNLVHTGYAIGGDYRINSGIHLNRTEHRYIQGRWRMVWSENPYIKQLHAGTALRSPYHPTDRQRFHGIRISNYDANIYRTYSTIEFTEPVNSQRDVELYHNQQLIDYRSVEKTDSINASIPMHYGSQSVTMNIYGPHGEYRQVDHFMFIPSRMIQPGHWKYEAGFGHSPGFHPGKDEYRWQGGISGGYGVTQKVSILGGGSLNGHDDSPRGFLELIWNPHHKHALSGYLTHRKRWGLNWKYNKTGNQSIRMDFSHRLKSPYSFYMRSNHYRNEGRILYKKYGKIGPVRGNIHFSGRYTSYSHYKSGILEFGSGARWKDIRLRVQPGWRFRTNARSSPLGKFRLKATLQFLLLDRYHVYVNSEWWRNSRNGRKTSFQLHRRLGPHWQVSISGSRYGATSMWSFGARIRLQLPFAKNSVSTRQTDGQWLIHQQMSGSFWYHPDEHKIQASERGWDQKGAVQLIPYNDLNENGKRDREEPWLDPSAIKLNSSTANSGGLRIGTHTLYRSYTPQWTSIETSAFTHMKVPTTFKRITFRPYPNIFNQVAIPLHIVADISGKVQVGRELSDPKLEPGAWNIIIREEGQGPVDTVRTLPSGRFYRNNLSAGNYIIAVDSAQLKKLGIAAQPKVIDFGIQPDQNKGHIRHLRFELGPIRQD